MTALRRASRGTRAGERRPRIGGVEVTIAIAAVTTPSNIFVCVSDRVLSIRAANTKLTLPSSSPHQAMSERCAFFRDGYI
jgi:hypothetical protein